jgi:predicted RNase H-like HicB family nuclease
MSMLRSVTAVIEREGDGYVAICPEFDIASQGHTIEGARSNLTEALTLFFETVDASEIDRRSQREVFITQVEVPVG